jgi:hypothetical protein
MHQRARTDPSGGRGATRVPTGTQENADLGLAAPPWPTIGRAECCQSSSAKRMILHALLARSGMSGPFGKSCVHAKYGTPLATH